MSIISDGVERRVAEYVRALAMRREMPALARLREETAGMERGLMQISVEQGRLMGLLMKLLGVRKAIEVGVFTGYSSICVAAALPPAPQGKLVACDVSAEWTEVARRYWREAGVEDRIELRLGPAVETLHAMLRSGEAGVYDFAFIDADKPAYDAYYELCLELLKPGGALAVDNMFMHGTALPGESGDEDGDAIRALAEKIYSDARVEPSLIPIGDGFLLAQKR